ncbi:ABC transporter substrate-binding protein [Bradyrhizobium sp. CNPSo 4010]|uniref:ABC transporter substrate-binding protein n=1 Tax=Bradyrhizobium agreste TaxID=2751811 RepID=A0ABS0PNS6_9BRAD|nr:ABC transporter substrate-binding protein [Bradyrhizobium agreste]MBH5398856.1 ABC transporter substrate-binding protein [Bradyrhizobium agreste]
MRRRAFLGFLAITAISAREALAQKRVPVVGFVGFATPDIDNATLVPFRKALAELGYVEGRTIVIEAHSTAGDVSRGLALIDDLVARQVDVLLSPGPAAARAMVRKTNIPVVAVALPAVQSDPELFQSLARPGGSLTGFAAFGEEMSAKRIEMIREILPALKRIGVLNNATDPTFSAWGAQTIEEARRAGLEPVRLGLTSASPAAVAEQFNVLANAGGNAVIVIRDYMTAAMQDEICRIGLDMKIAVIGQQREFAHAGALISYGADIGDLFRRAAGYIDLILKGQKPANMPIQLPTKFELAVNLKTARALGVTIPPTILVLTDEVIE